MGIKAPVSEYIVTSYTDNAISKSSLSLFKNLLPEFNSGLSSSLLPPEQPIFRPFFPELNDKETMFNHKIN